MYSYCSFSSTTYCPAFNLSTWWRCCLSSSTSEYNLHFPLPNSIPLAYHSRLVHSYALISYLLMSVLLLCCSLALFVDDLTIYHFHNWLYCIPKHSTHASEHTGFHVGEINRWWLIAFISSYTPLYDTWAMLHEHLWWQLCQPHLHLHQPLMCHIR